MRLLLFILLLKDPPSLGDFNRRKSLFFCPFSSWVDLIIDWDLNYNGKHLREKQPGQSRTILGTKAARKLDRVFVLLKFGEKLKIFNSQDKVLS